jgi:hypothetical protein
MHSPWPLSLGRPRRPLRAMATATEGVRVGRQSPTVGRVCLRASSTGGGARSARLGFSTTCETAPEEVGMAPRLLYAFAEASYETT